MQNPNSHYGIRNIPLLALVLVLRQINLFHSLPSYVFSIHFNIIMPSSPGTFKCFVLVSCLYQNVYACLFIPSRPTSTAHLVLLGTITAVTFTEDYSPLSSSQIFSRLELLHPF
jgi:hypothetical protein